MIKLKINKKDNESIHCHLAVDNYEFEITSKSFKPDIKKLISLDYVAAKTYGGKLLDLLIPRDQRENYTKALQAASATSNVSPILLEVGTNELDLLPWELAYDSILDRFMCLSKHTPIIRYKPSLFNTTILTANSK